FQLVPWVYDNRTNQWYAGWAGGDDIPLNGDWFHQGHDDAGIYDPATSTFYLFNTNQGNIPPAIVEQIVDPHGAPISGYPLAGDWDGNGYESVGLFNWATNEFLLRNSTTTGVADLDFSFGSARAGWFPLAGDWNGDGVGTIGLYDPASTTFYLRNSNSPGAA